MASRLAVVLEVSGLELRGWESVAVSRAVDQIAGTFALSVSELNPDDPLARELRVGEPCTVRVGDDVVLSGHIETRRVSYSERTHTVAISGREVTGDLVDCSADRSPGEWQRQTIARIAADLVAPFPAVSLLPVPDPGAPFERFRLQPGERVFDALSRASRLRGLTPSSDGRGGVRLSVPGAELAPVSIDRRESGQVLGGEISENAAGRFSRVRVIGQTDQVEAWQGSTGGPAQSGEAFDPGVARFRPLVLVESQRGDAGALRRRAEYETTTRAARARPVGYRMAGWTAPGGWLWQPGFRVPVFDPLLGVGLSGGGPREMLIASVSLSLDETGGQVAALELVDPVAFQVLRLPEKPTPAVALWEYEAPAR